MNKIRKIFHIVYSFESIGGLENGLINIVNNSDTSKFQHVICSLTTVGSLSSRITNSNVSFYNLGKQAGNDFSLPFKIYKILRHEAPDVVHLRNWPTMVEGFIAAKMLGRTKIIYSEHGRHFESVWQKQYFKTAVIRFVLSHVDQCLCVSNDVAVEMQQLYQLKRTVDVVLNGVDTTKFCPFEVTDKRSKEGWVNAINVGSVGRLDKGKRYYELISDFAEHIQGANLIIAGGGPESTRLNKLVDSLGKEKCVYLPGSVNNISELLNCFDFFVLPSESEGLSNAIMEAMSCGLPIIAYDVGGNKELVVHGKGGYLIKAGDRKSFIEKINYLSGNMEQIKEMGLFNRNYIEKNYSLSLMIEKYNSLYSI